MAFWLFNRVASDTPASRLAEQVGELLDDGKWDVGRHEPHADSLAPGDLVLIYLGAPSRVFVARAQLDSAMSQLPPGGPGSHASSGPRMGVRLVRVDRWDPPVPMEAVLSRIDPASRAKADFDKGVVGISRHEFEAALAAAAR